MEMEARSRLVPTLKSCTASGSFPDNALSQFEVISLNAELSDIQAASLNEVFTVNDFGSALILFKVTYTPITDLLHHLACLTGCENRL